jgi:hypothetical protein
MNSRWIVVNQQTTNSIVVSSSYSMVGEINHLANFQNEGVTEALLLLKNIYNLKDEPNDAKANKEEWYDTGTYSIDSYIKHTVWPVLVLPIH